MKTFAFVVLLAIVAGLIWIRLAPIEADDWHSDPADVDDPQMAGVRLIGREAPRFAADPERVLSAFREIALDEPRTRLLDGSIDEGLMTFVVRTKFMGFPDFVTVKAVDEGDVTKLSVASRARFKGSDWGVNSERLDRWLQDLRLRLG